jgi:hypothetical protein
VIELDQDMINDGSANSLDGTGIATVGKVAVLPTENYLQLASLSGGVITDTRVAMAIDIDALLANVLEVDEIRERTADNGVLIDEILCRDGYFDFEERIGDPSTPSTNHWRLFFLEDGLYQMDETGVAFRVGGGTAVTEPKDEASATDGEIFENEDQGNGLAWKNSRSEVYGLIDAYQLGEAFSGGEPASLMGAVAYGGANLQTTTDTYVDLNNPATNYVTATGLHLENGNEEAYFQFDFSGIPDMYRLISFDFVCNQTVAGSNDLEIYPIETAVNLATVTWNTQPTISSNWIGTVTAVGTGTKTISATVGNKLISDYIVNNGLRLQNDNVGTVQIEALNAAGTAEAYLTNIVYMANDGRIYRTDASHHESVANYVGIVQEAGAEDDWRPVINSPSLIEMAGVVRNSVYYLSNTLGDIGTTPGTNPKIIGKGADTDRLRLEERPIFRSMASTITPSANGQVFTIPHYLGKMPNKVLLSWGKATNSTSFEHVQEGRMALYLPTGGPSIYSVEGSAGNKAWGDTNNVLRVNSTTDGGSTAWSGTVEFDEENITVTITSYTTNVGVRILWEVSEY